MTILVCCSRCEAATTSTAGDECAEAEAKAAVQPSLAGAVIVVAVATCVVSPS